MPVIGYFEDGGFPAGNRWDELPFPGFNDDHAYALEVSSHSMLWIARIVWAMPVGTRHRDRRPA